jgi:hypothetical protein
MKPVWRNSGFQIDTVHMCSNIAAMIIRSPTARAVIDGGTLKREQDN